MELRLAPAAGNPARGVVWAAWLVGAAVTLAAFGAGWGTWNLTHWLFSWEHGFVKRGLVGTVYGAFVDVATIRGLVLLQCLVGIVTAAGLTALVASAVRRDAVAHHAEPQMLSLKAALVAAVLLASPGLIQQVFFDLGRFDVFGLLLLLLVTATLPRLGRAAGLAICVVASVIALLVHEAFGLWVAPAALALWYDQWRGVPWTLHALVAALFGLAVVTASIYQFSYSMYFDLEGANAMLQQRANFPIHPTAMQVHFRGIADNITHSAENAFNVRRLAGAAMGLAVVAAYTWLLLALLGSAARRTLGQAAVLAGLASAPLGLMVVGYDFGRWLAMVNATLVFLFVSAVTRGAPVLSTLSEGRMLTLLLAGIILMLLGPFGHVDTFPQTGLYAFFGVLTPVVQ